MTYPAGEGPVLDPSLTAAKPTDVRIENSSLEVKETNEVETRLAVIKEEAIKKVQESVSAQTIGVDELVKRLLEENTKIPYAERSVLVQNLLQVADAKRAIGESMDEEVIKVLEKVYEQLAYSKLFQEELSLLLKNVNDPDLIGTMLSDEKFTNTFTIASSLKTDEQRERAFAKCKQRVSVAAQLIQSSTDPVRALQLLREIPGLSLMTPDKRSIGLGMTPETIAQKLFKAEKIDVLIDAVKTGVIHLIEMKPVINRLQEQPNVLLALAKEGHDIKGVEYLLKFLADPDQIQVLIDQGAEVFPNLSSEDAEKALRFAQTVKEALSKEPNLIPLGSFIPDQPSEFDETEMEARNKFVVGIDSNHTYCIAWGNMNNYAYHKDLFQRTAGSVGKLEPCGGGFVSFTEESDKVHIKLQRNSGDFGFYSYKVLQRFQEKIVEAMKKSYPGKQIEFTLEPSKAY